MTIMILIYDQPTYLIALLSMLLYVVRYLFFISKKMILLMERQSLSTHEHIQKKMPTYE